MMSKKDEALKKCLRVLNPIANENVYETQWIDSAIHAAYEALEEKEWQGLSDEEISKLIKENVAIDCTCDPNGFIEAIEQKLKEKNNGTT